MAKRKTAGELANQALADNEKYDAWDLAKTWSKSVLDEVWKCIDHAKPRCADQEFCVVMLYASDCVIKNAIRRKFYAWPWLPQPRPNQAVWLYRKSTDDIQGLWCLPEPYTMAKISTDIQCPKEYLRMSSWCRSFFNGTFPKDIRKESGIDLLTEEEYSKKHAHLMKKREPSTNDSSIFGSDPFDFFKPFQTDQVKDSALAMLK